MKRQPSGENICKWSHQQRISKTQTAQHSSVITAKWHNQKQAGDLNRHSPKEDIQMARGHVRGAHHHWLLEM